MVWLVQSHATTIHEGESQCVRQNHHLFHHHSDSASGTYILTCVSHLPACLPGLDSLISNQEPNHTIHKVASTVEILLVVFFSLGTSSTVTFSLTALGGKQLLCKLHLRNSDMEFTAKPQIANHRPIRMNTFITIMVSMVMSSVHYMAWQVITIAETCISRWAFPQLVWSQNSLRSMHSAAHPYRS